MYIYIYYLYVVYTCGVVALRVAVGVVQYRLLPHIYRSLCPVSHWRYGDQRCLRGAGGANTHCKICSF